MMGNNGPAAAPGDGVLVTGCSTGLGLEIALHLASRGLHVYATLRDASRGGELVAEAQERGVQLQVLPMDVTDRRSVDAAVEVVLGSDNGLYGLVNNAGIGLRGCLEDLEEDEIRQVFEANVFGTMAVTRRVLPHMRQAGRGRIITISSVGGRIATFGLSAYCSTKFALEGFGESLALELAPLGLASVLIEPGIINTSRWSVNRGLARRASDPSSPYYEMFQREEAIAAGIAERSRTQPPQVAETVYEALTAASPRMRYVVGRPASAAIVLRRYMPERLFERVYFGSLLKRLRPAAQAA